MSELLHVGVTISCVHQASASASTGASRVKVSGQQVWTTGTRPTVSSCQFKLPNGVPQPCVSIRWTTGASRVTTGGVAIVLRTSTAQCLSGQQIVQGVATVSSEQTRAVGT